MQRNNQIKEIKKDMDIILLIFTLIALFCCICSFFIGIDLGKELQKKEDENKNKNEKREFVEKRKLKNRENIKKRNNKIKKKNVTKK